MFSGGWVVGAGFAFPQPSPKNLKRIDHPLGAIDLKGKYLAMRTISSVQRIYLLFKIIFTAVDLMLHGCINGLISSPTHIASDGVRIVEKGKREIETKHIEIIIYYYWTM